ncbi:LysM peptidoglycan-binding domain-containing protein [Roseibium sp.]|uniref:LysM peptidoglycan-binding domain-containing protein n=1 Tax=Roseibium sp. TaxID=1936156 RepID=UPI003A987CFD
MTKLAVIRATAVAVVVGVAALVTGYFYQNGDMKLPADAPETVEQSASAPASSPASDASGTGDAADAGTSSGDGGSSAATVAKSDRDSEAAKAPATTQPETDSAVASDDSLSFDVVGVEPTGDAVVAGRAEAGSIVALTANGQVVGKTIANNKGEWTIILDKPLPAGDYDVGLQMQDEDGKARQESSQRLTVSIPEGGKEQPLVVLNAPDAPSTLIQKPAPDESAPGAETQIAAAPETATQETAAPETEPTAQDDAGTSSADAQKPMPDSAQGTAEAPAVADSTVDTAATADTAAQASGEKPAEAGQGAVQETVVATADTAGDAASAPEAGASAAGSSAGGASAETPAVTAPASAQPAAASSDTATSDTPEPAAVPAETEVAAVTAETPAASSETAGSSDEAALVITVDAVESERGTVYVAGTGPAGRRVQVYVGETLLGSVVIGDQDRWLIQGDMALAAGAVEVRADLTGDNGSVISRAAVTFEKEAEAIVLTKVVASAKGTADSEAVEAKVAKPLPNVIIRKGDNLWRISRRLYGDGFRYTTIYQANKSQIRDPDLIYPGQVFLTPEGDLNWKAPQN